MLTRIFTRLKQAAVIIIKEEYARFRLRCIKRRTGWAR